MTSQPSNDEMSQVSAQLSAESVERLATLQPHPDVVSNSSGESTDSTPWDETTWLQKWDSFPGVVWASADPS